MSEHNEPAFPFTERNDDGSVYASFSGLTKRELIALLMAAAIRAGQPRVDSISVAESAMHDADALIYVLTKAPTNAEVKPE